MTVTLNLNAEELAVLNSRAQLQGTSIETVLHGLVTEIKSAPAQVKQEAAAALMQNWLTEKEQLTKEELEQNDRDFEDFKTNMNRWRAEEGRPPAFR